MSDAALHVPLPPSHPRGTPCGATNKAGLTFATANVLGVTALDVICAQQLSREAGKMTEDGAIRTRRRVAINRSREDLYRHWRDFQNLPAFMYHLESVQVLDERRSHWVAKGPAGKRVEWDSEITAEQPNEMIAWRSMQGSDVYNAGSVEFEARPGGRGTIVRVALEYRPPGGIAGTAFAMLFNQSPEQQIYDDLRRFKQIMEIGEVVRSDASPEGTGGMTPSGATRLTLTATAKPILGQHRKPHHESELCVLQLLKGGGP